MKKKYAAVNKWTRPRPAIVLAVSMTLMATAANAAKDILILAPTVTGGFGSLEATTAANLLLSVDVVPPGSAPGQWANPPQPYNQYKAIVLGDVGCSGSPAPVAAAENNFAAWALAVTGNVVIIGTDPTVHKLLGGAQLWKSAIDFAAAGPGTGAVIALGCYYGGAVSPTQVDVLKGFGVFMTQRANCANNVAIVAASPALNGLASSDLSGWGCSVHEGFTAWPTGFIPLAIATDASVPHNFTTTGGTSGFPYILARGKTLTPIDGGGVLKVCKVAGTGIAVGTPFSFTAGSSTFTVPAGPAPGGTCVVGPSFPVGSTVTVKETIPAGDAVSSITVAPAGHLVGTPNLASGTVSVTIGTGVTEVTYTDNRTGFLEICKRGDVKGNFTFTVNPGGLGPFVVPAGGCSPAIKVPAGSVVINEQPRPGVTMIGCATIPVGLQGPCNLGSQSSTVTVKPGDVSNQTIAWITNRKSGLEPGHEADPHE